MRILKLTPISKSEYVNDCRASEESCVTLSESHHQIQKTTAVKRMYAMTMQIVTNVKNRCQ